MRRLVLGFLIVSSILVTFSPASALKMCGRAGPGGVLRDGATVRLRATCKPSEVEIDPVAVGLQGPAGAPGADGEDGLAGPPGPVGPTGPGMVARDANDAQIGVAQTGDDLDAIAAIATVEIEGARRTIWAGLDTEGFRSWTFGEALLYFTTLDCSGDAFIASSGHMSVPAIVRGPMDAQGFVSGPGTTAYFVACGFRRSRSPRPRQADQSFRAKPITWSERWRAPSGSGRSDAGVPSLWKRRRGRGRADRVPWGEAMMKTRG